MTLQHVALEVRRADEEATVAFWQALGFAPVDPPPALRARSTWLQRGPAQIHLLFTETPVAPPQGHAAVVAEDFPAAIARLRALGHEPEPRERHWGAERVFVTAPGGHRVEVMAAPP